MSEIGYFDFCEGLWQDWLNDRLELPPEASKLFQLDYCPEPYLLFRDAGPDSIHFLTTNPGGGMSIQHRSAVAAGDERIVRPVAYAPNAASLGRYYSSDEFRQRERNAAARVRSMHVLAARLGQHGLLQVECVPFHSPKLDEKPRVVPLIEQIEVLHRYSELLRSYLADKSVIAISAVDPSRDISGESVRRSAWLNHKAGLMGIEPSRLTVHDIVRKETSGRVSGALVVAKRTAPVKAFFLMMGGNRLPAAEGIELIAEILCRG